MKPLSGTMRLLGHPLVAVPLILGGLAMLWACWQRGADAVVPAIVTSICLVRVLNASEQVSQHRAWKGAWNGMTEQSAGPSRRWRWVVGLALLALSAIYWSGKFDAEQVPVAILVAAIPLALFLLWAGARWARRRMPRGRRRECVALAADAPLMRVPELKDAYQVLPDYCQRVLADGAR